MRQSTSKTAGILCANPKFWPFIGATDEASAAAALRAQVRMLVATIKEAMRRA